MVIINRNNKGKMEQIVLSLHNNLLKRQIEKYAKKRGTSISGMVENYFQNIIKIEEKEDISSYRLPEELDTLLDGIEVSEELKTRNYKSLRDDMYAFQ